MKQDVIDIASNALNSLNTEWGIDNLPYIEIEIPKNEKMGDFAITVAMRLTKLLKRPPKEIAKEIVGKINEQRPDFFEKIEIAGPGFINLRLKKEYLYNNLGQLLKDGRSSLSTDIGKGRKVQVEFVSANPTGPLHIGHGRGAAVGNALCNVLMAAGFDVQKEFYINDAGLQVMLLGQSVFARYKQLLGNDQPFPEDGYKGDYIKSIAEDIRNSSSDKYLNSTFNECGEFFTECS
jgi:arginyl-tRNA synthetase